MRTVIAALCFTPFCGHINEHGPTSYPFPVAWHLQDVISVGLGVWHLGDIKSQIDFPPVLLDASLDKKFSNIRCGKILNNHPDNIVIEY